MKSKDTELVNLRILAISNNATIAAQATKIQDLESQMQNTSGKISELTEKVKTLEMKVYNQSTEISNLKLGIYQLREFQNRTYWGAQYLNQALSLQLADTNVNAVQKDDFGGNVSYSLYSNDMSQVITGLDTGVKQITVTSTLQKLVDIPEINGPIVAGTQFRKWYFVSDGKQLFSYQQGNGQSFRKDALQYPNLISMAACKLNDAVLMVYKGKQIAIYNTSSQTYSP